MARWLIRTYTSDTGAKPVESWIRSLAAESRAEVLTVVDLLERHGVELEMPYTRHLGDGLWELRVRDRSGIYRVIYFHWKGRTFGLLHGFSKKTQTTPKGELDLARSRRATWLERTRKLKGSDNG